MKNKNGFTLLELLVVVLIIGILAAIALPQYKTARDKAVIVSFLPMIKAIKDAEEIHYMTHGQYKREFDTLDIDITKNASCSQYHNMMFCKKGYIDLVYDASGIKGWLVFNYCPKIDKVTLTNYSSCGAQAYLSIITYLSNHPTKPNQTTCSGPKKLCQIFI